MYRILFMPFLQIPSGHHHVADTIKNQLNQSSNDFHFEKVEMLSYCYGKVEILTSSFYLQWIDKFPSVYSKIYKTVVKRRKSSNSYYLYEVLFLKKIRNLIEQTKPDIIICTHALPSYLLNKLKKGNIWNGPVINVYTDYFINDLWGKERINYHFVPSLHHKQELIMRGIKPKQIFVTGIPIDSIFKSKKETSSNNDKLNILISGGNMGAGSIQQLLQTLNPSGSILYKVLCGKNEMLFQHIEQLNYPSIKPLPYLNSKEEMNQLYDEADAIITKPGGVTISECLWKRLPIFVFEALPGQEEFNLNYLKSQGLIFHLDNWNSPNNIENVITDILMNDLSTFNERLESFYMCFEKNDASQIIEKIIMS
ncbi:MGDG synthase family glycosyltransferase [Oceanobacillus jeddahense]|uniref:MGDG synthase family glycosyltransferase n=1 Tax=Oceanobacillus jeddahense TaxID=1462527 RepID=UPI000595FEAA|nr:glycosyltransferase [Oceanobacillus jeddahense]